MAGNGKQRGTAGRLVRAAVFSAVRAAAAAAGTAAVGYAVWWLQHR